MGRTAESSFRNVLPGRYCDQWGSVPLQAPPAFSWTSGCSRLCKEINENQGMERVSCCMTYDVVEFDKKRGLRYAFLIALPKAIWEKCFSVIWTDLLSLVFQLVVKQTNILCPVLWVQQTWYSLVLCVILYYLAVRLECAEFSFFKII